MFDDLFDEMLGRTHRNTSQYTNHADITYAKLDSLDAKSKAREATTEVAFLKQKVEKLMMITEALWIVLKETTNYTDEDLKEIIREVDMKDGKLDGKVAAEAPGTCPNCGQTLQKNKNICIYCGTEIEIEDVFKDKR